MREENAAALEVMSRFATDPWSLPYLPPTMSPVATCTRLELLEHPEVLATEGVTYHDRPHAFHLDLADRLVAAAPELIAPTRRLFLDTTDPVSVADGTAWWEELTAAGGEGMVVKPAANLGPGVAKAWRSQG